VTETCDTAVPADDSDGEGDGSDATPPHLIVNGETTDATVADNQMTEPIHARLGQRGLLPGEHLVDSGYPWAQLLVSAPADYAITLVTQMLADTSPQAGRLGGSSAPRLPSASAPSTPPAPKAVPAARGIRSPSAALPPS
jgi:hypothetical protein